MQIKNDKRQTVLNWNFPAFVIYLTPLNGLYASPCMSNLLTFIPEMANWFILKFATIGGGSSCPLFEGAIET